MKPETLSSCIQRLEKIRYERDVLRTQVAELEAAAKLAWTAIIELRYSNSTDKARSVSEFAVEALRKAGVK